MSARSAEDFAQRVAMSNRKTTVRLKVSPEVAQIVAKDSPREVRLSAARGDAPLPPGDLPVALFLLFHGGDPEIKTLAAATLKRLPADLLAEKMTNPDLHPRFLDLVARLRLNEPGVAKAILSHPAVESDTLLYAAGHGNETVLAFLADLGEEVLNVPGLVQALGANPKDSPSVRDRFLKAGGPPPRKLAGSPDGEAPEAAEASEATEASEAEEELNQSKYQLSLDMGVSEKIKVAMTGDKEWRSILIRDANKLVSSAVLKNPRITEAEVLAVAKNRSTSDELIRIVTLNREWLKNYEIKKTLVMHPRTPLPKALRFMSILTERDLKMLAKSRNVSRVIVNSARRMLIAKEKKSR
jgi:hypothetical protein